jgi:hypothetical protein
MLSNGLRKGAPAADEPDLANVEAAVHWELLTSRNRLRWARVYLICMFLLSAESIRSEFAGPHHDLEGTLFYGLLALISCFGLVFFRRLSLLVAREKVIRRMKRGVSQKRKA